MLGLIVFTPTYGPFDSKHPIAHKSKFTNEIIMVFDRNYD